MKKTPGGGNNKSDGADGNQRSRDLSVFSKAVSLFNAGKFAEAKQLFDQLARVPDTSLAHAARSRALICERRSRPS
ncbi:MAG TPA: hypothetical protein VGP62_01365 [Bryobacteraceae bacterium]|jgi:hypothetical protein|nr:hypothetical protein [Bryobacteraceae bacterium]